MNSNVTGTGVAVDDDVKKTVSFEHRHENKSSSACPKDLHKKLGTLDKLTILKLNRFPALV